MERNELYLKTAFCCMACDGDIAPEEIELIKSMPLFQNTDWNVLPQFVEKLKNEGNTFLVKFLDELSQSALSEDEERKIAKVAIETIEADSNVEYNEIAFFKKIRRRLQLSDEKLLEIIPEDSILPDREDYLQPDLSDSNDFSLWNGTFENIALHDNA